MDEPGFLFFEIQQLKDNHAFKYKDNDKSCQ